MLLHRFTVFVVWAACIAAGASVRAQPPSDSAPTLVPPAIHPEFHGHPSYPDSADGRPVRVVLRIVVDETGDVDEASVISTDRDGSDAEQFERLALDFVRTVEFTPATKAGEPIPAVIRFDVFFDPPGEPPHEHAEPSGHPDPSDSRDTPSFGATAVVSTADLSASSMDIGGEEIRLRPYLSTGDLLNAAPGVYSIQHAGGGKANQYFLRGFDADHGTDMAFYVDGVPINWVSHGHGQGYTDLHFVIPELIQRVEVKKGPYFAEYGDFSTAGTINLVLDSEKPTSSFSFLGGTYRTFRGVGIVSPKLDKFHPLLAVDILGSDGPFENPENQLRFNLFSRVSVDLPRDTKIAITASLYGNRWNASGQIPLREVEAGRLDRFGSIDPSEGGESSRYSLYLNVVSPSKAGAFGARSVSDQGLELVAWVTRSDFALYSNFTFFANDPVNGDMIQQTDLRTTLGTRAQYGFRHLLGRVTLKTRFGTNLRVDWIDNGLADAPDRTVTNVRVDARIGQTSVGLFGEEELAWRWLRVVGGLRVDFFNFDVADRLPLEAVTSSDRRGDVIVSPKGSVIVNPVEPLHLFFNFGRGFHSNDARGVVQEVDPVTPLTPALGWEVGARVLAWDRLQLSTVFFWLDLDSEVVWVGDEGVTEPSGATRRLGVEFQTRAELTRWLLADFDLTWVRAEFVNNPGNANAIALAPELLISAGLSARDERTGLSGRIGLFYLADRPATEDRFLTAEGFVRLDASFGWDNERFGIKAQVLNVLNTRWRQAQFATTGRLPGEDGPAACPPGTRPVSEGGTFVGCEDLHFTPGWPIHLQVMATVKF
ncbi:MAG: TonB-dependent receptor domain-containing protein [Polyangiales bacterium]